MRVRQLVQPCSAVHGVMFMLTPSIRAVSRKFAERAATAPPYLNRLFEHEGGLAAYARNRRLREAADEFVRSVDLAVVDIA